MCNHVTLEFSVPEQAAEETKAAGSWGGRRPREQTLKRSFLAAHKRFQNTISEVAVSLVAENVI